jgi:hypothetical protein
MHAQIPTGRITFSAPSISIAMRVYYSMYHFWSAKHLSAIVGHLEQTGDGQPRFDIQHRSFATSSILASVSFLESAINELLKDAADSQPSQGHRTGYAATIPDNIVESYAKLCKERYGAMRKYNQALQLAGQPEFEKDQPIFENVSLLIELRNELIHFMPETIVDGELRPLHKRLKGRFPQSKLMAGSGNPFFPDHCLGHGCCEWGVSSAQAIVDEFFTRVGLAPKYRAVPWPDPTDLESQRLA